MILNLSPDVKKIAAKSSSIPNVKFSVRNHDFNEYVVKKDK